MSGVERNKLSAYPCVGYGSTGIITHQWHQTITKGKGLIIMHVNDSPWRMHWGSQLKLVFEPTCSHGHGCFVRQQFWEYNVMHRECVGGNK